MQRGTSGHLVVCACLLPAIAQHQFFFFSLFLSLFLVSSFGSCLRVISMALESPFHGESIVVRLSSSLSCFCHFMLSSVFVSFPPGTREDQDSPFAVAISCEGSRSLSCCCSCCFHLFLFCALSFFSRYPMAFFKKNRQLLRGYQGTLKSFVFKEATTPSLSLLQL